MAAKPRRGRMMPGPELSPTAERTPAVDPSSTNLEELVRLARRDALEAWDPTHALPWADPDFSARMLLRHLDPRTHSASRPPEVVVRHLDWLEARTPAGPVLDLCCGPGLYCHELARRGRRTVGVDVAPAAVTWAREQAARSGLDCTFLMADLAREFPQDALAQAPLAAVTCWFGDIHAFRRPAATGLLSAACAALAPGGLLILEMQPWDEFPREDDLSATAVQEGLFCDEPHLWVQRHRWDADAETEVHGHWILAGESARLATYVQCHQAWRADRLDDLLTACGLVDPAWHAPIAGLDAGFEFPVLVARRAAAGGGP